MLSILPLSCVLFFVSGIETGNETGSTYDVLGASLDICGTIITSLNWSTRSKLTKELFKVII